MAATPAESAPAPGRPAEPSVLAIPNAHIDPVWIWDWREGLREVIATFTAAADRLDQHPGLSFAASSACYYEWVEQLDPELFGRIRAHVAAGRWELVGGEWIEPDCNLPAGESVCRQLLYSQRYFQRAFGTTATIGYNIDSFGHAASLPQLFRKAGLRAYIMMRPGPHEKELPASLFRWQGVDGTGLVTYRIREAYHTGLPGDEAATASAERTLIETRAATLLAEASAEKSPAMFFVGVGDHGGGPTRIAIDAVQRLRAETSGGVAFGSTAGYFDRIARELATGGELPTVRGDLHMHAVGCYTAVAWMKRENAACEAGLAAAENLAAVAELATGIRLDAQDTLRSAWTRVLFNQFHDSLGGTCTEEVCEDLRQFYGYARTQADAVLTRATQLLAMRADTAVAGAEAAERNQSLNPFVAHFPVPLVVFNPLSRPVRVPLELPHPATSVTTGDDEPVPVQPIASREGTRYAQHGLVVADLPALGHRVFWLRKEAEPNGAATAAAEAGPGWAATEAGRLENDDLVVEVDRAAGVVTGITSKPDGRQWLAAEGLRPVVLADPSDTWSHFVVRYSEPERECSLAGLQWVETGPVRTVARLRYVWDRSTIWMDLILYRGLAELEVKLRVDWHQRHQLVKLIVPVAADRPVIDAGVPYGTVERAADGREEVLNHWIGVREPSGSGVLCSSDVGYAYDADGGRLRFTVLRSPRYADHGRPWTTDDPISAPATDQGGHEVSYRFRFSGPPLPPGAGARQADVHTARFPAVTETWHPGPLGRESSAVAVTPGHVSVPVLKRAEAGGGWVLRVCEQAGQPAATSITLPFADRTWTGRLRPYDVVTLFVPDQPGQPVREIALTELDPGPDGPDPAGGG
jgi:alpha-mannosidase